MELLVQNRTREFLAREQTANFDKQLKKQQEKANLDLLRAQENAKLENQLVQKKNAELDAMKNKLYLAEMQMRKAMASIDKRQNDKKSSDVSKNVELTLKKLDERISRIEKVLQRLVDKLDDR